MKKQSINGMFLIVLLTMAIMLSGCWNKSPEKRAEHITDRVADELDLNETQKLQLKNSVTQLLEQGEELREMRTSMINELAQQLRQEKINSTSLNAVVDQNKAKLESMMNLFLQEFAEFHQSLTPEQRMEAAKQLEEFKEKRSRRRHSWFS